MTVVQRSPEGGHPGIWRGTPLGSHPHPPSTSLARPPIPCRQPLRGGRHSLPSCPRKETLEQPSCPRRRESRGLAGHSSREHASTVIHTLPSTSLARPPQACRHARERRPLNNRHSREGGNPGVLAGHSTREVSTPSVNPLGKPPHPAVNPFGEAATAYRHAREGAGIPAGGNPAVWRGTPLGRHPHPAVNLLGEAIHILPSTPSWRPPQPTVMPAKAGIQWSGGHSSREAAKLSLRDALIHYRNFMNQSVRKVLTKHERRF